MPHSQKESQLSGLRARMRRHWYSVRLDSSRPRASTPKSSSTLFRRRQLPVAKNNNSWAKSRSKYPGPKSSAAGDDRLAATGTRTEGKEKFSKGRCSATVVRFAFAAFLLALGPRSCEHVIPICQRLTLLQDLWSAI